MEANVTDAVSEGVGFSLGDVSKRIGNGQRAAPRLGSGVRTFGIAILEKVGERFLGVAELPEDSAAGLGELDGPFAKFRDDDV